MTPRHKVPYQLLENGKGKLEGVTLDLLLLGALVLLRLSSEKDLLNLVGLLSKHDTGGDVGGGIDLANVGGRCINGGNGSSISNALIVSAELEQVLVDTVASDDLVGEGRDLGELTLLLGNRQALLLQLLLLLGLVLLALANLHLLLVLVVLAKGVEVLVVDSLLALVLGIELLLEAGTLVKEVVALLPDLILGLCDLVQLSLDLVVLGAQGFGGLIVDGLLESSDGGLVGINGDLLGLCSVNRLLGLLQGRDLGQNALLLDQLERSRLELLLQLAVDRSEIHEECQKDDKVGGWLDAVY